MRNVLVFTFLYALQLACLAQSSTPSFNYQFIVRDSSGVTIANDTVDVEYYFFCYDKNDSTQYLSSSSVCGLVTNQYGLAVSTVEIKHAEWQDNTYLATFIFYQGKKVNLLVNEVSGCECCQCFTAPSYCNDKELVKKRYAEREAKANRLRLQLSLN